MISISHFYCSDHTRLILSPELILPTGHCVVRANTLSCSQYYVRDVKYDSRATLLQIVYISHGLVHNTPC